MKRFDYGYFIKPIKYCEQALPDIHNNIITAVALQSEKMAQNLAQFMCQLLTQEKVQCALSS